jgi:hypothetical protein
MALTLSASGCAEPGATTETDAAVQPMPGQTEQARNAPGPQPALPQAPAADVLPSGSDPFRDPNPLVPRVRVPAPLPPGGDGGRTAEAIDALEGRVDLLSRRGWPYGDLLPVGVDPHP